MSWKLRAVSTFRKALSRSKESSNVKAGMSSWHSKCETKSMAQPVDPVACPAKCVMDEATVPCGDWKENYDLRNAKHTQLMVAGIVFFLFSCFMVKRDGFIKGYPYSAMYI